MPAGYSQCLSAVVVAVSLMAARGLALAADATVVEPVVAAVPASVVPLIEGVDAGPLAAAMNGQIVYLVDEAAGGVIGCDPAQPQKRWLAVAAPSDRGARPASIACIGSSHLVAVRRTEGNWMLETFRLPAPAATPAAEKPDESTALGTGPSADQSAVTVGFAREWLAITGLPAPLPNVLAYRIRGAKPAQELCREPLQSRRVVAAATTSDDALVVFSAEPARPAAAARLSIRRPADPRPLLDLDTGLPNLRAAACGRSDGTLWVLAGEAGTTATPPGLWRIDGVMRDGRQAVRPVCVARIDAPRSLAWVAPGMILVSHGDRAGRVVHVDPTAARLEKDGGR